MIRQRHLRRHRHGVAGVDPHWVDVLDRADDHDVVLAIAHDLELELVPATHRFLDEDLSDRALEDAELDLPVELIDGLDEATTVAAKRECRPDHRRGGQVGQLGQVGDDAGIRRAQPDGANGLTKQFAVLGATNDRERRTDELHSELVENAGLCQFAGEVERGLAAHCREQRIGPLACEHVADPFEVEWLEIGPVCKPWFWLVTSTRPDARSRTGWFAPRCPNGSLKVSCPAASASSWWPRQIPSSGTRPISSRTTATSAASGPGSPGPFERSTPSKRR